MDVSTIENVRRRRSASLRQLARELGFPPGFAGTLCDIDHARHDHVSLRIENRVRVALGLAPIRRGRYIRPALSRDPAKRILQLRRLLAQAEAEVSQP